MTKSEKPRQHDLQCAERIRMTRLVEAGNPDEPSLDLLNALADEIHQHCGHTRFKAHRLARGWTVPAAVEAVHEMCKREQLGLRGLTPRSWMDWEAGKPPSWDYQDLVCRLFRTNPVRLGLAADYTPASEVVVVESRPAPRPARTVPEFPVVSDRGASEWERVAASAYESSEHAALAEASSVGTHALEQLADDVVDLAHAYSYKPLPILFNDMVRVRNRVYQLLDLTRRPDQERDLFLVAGQVCGLMARASFDLGNRHAAAAQARAARTYGEIIGHDELRAWCDGTLAIFEFWNDRPAEALRIIERGLACAPPGTPRIRLLGIAARALACEGDAARTHAAVAEAKDLQERALPARLLHDQIGGEFGFAEARQRFCFGAAFVRLGDAEAAIPECERAIQIYESTPPAQRWYAGEASAQVDLAAAHLLRGDLPTATRSLEPVFTLPPPMRVHGIIHRLRDVQDTMTNSLGKGARETKALSDQIGDFTAGSVAVSDAVEPR